MSQKNGLRPTRSGSASRSGSSVGGQGSRVMMIVLIVLAVVASVLMLFLDSELWLKIAVASALWAAGIGAVLVNRYAAALGTAAEREDTIERRMDAAIAKQKATLARREAQLQSDYQTKLAEQRDEHLDQIRQELVVLRAQLSELSGIDLSEDQPAVRATAERIIELENRSRSASTSANATATSSAAAAAATDTATPAVAPATTPVSETGTHTAKPVTTSNGRVDSSGATDPTTDPAPARQSAGAAAAAGLGSGPEGASLNATSATHPTTGTHKVDRGYHNFSTGTFAAEAWGGADAEETTQIPLVVDTTAMDSPAHAAPTQGSHSAGSHAAGSRGAHAAPSRPGAHAKPGDSSHRPHHAKPTPGSANPNTTAAAAAAAAAQPSAATTAADTADAPTGAHAAGRRGRRRADDSATGLTVAELMNRFKD